VTDVSVDNLPGQGGQTLKPSESVGGVATLKVCGVGVAMWATTG